MHPPLSFLRRGRHARDEKSPRSFPYHFQSRERGELAEAGRRRRVVLPSPLLGLWSEGFAIESLSGATAVATEVSRLAAATEAAVADVAVARKSLSASSILRGETGGGQSVGAKIDGNREELEKGRVWVTQVTKELKKSTLSLLDAKI